MCYWYLYLICKSCFFKRQKKYYNYWCFSKNLKTFEIWIDKGSECYNRSMKSWLQDNDIETYSTHNEGKPVVDERFIGKLKNKTYKYMILVTKNLYIDELADLVNKNNNTYHSTIKIKPVEVKSGTYNEFNKENNKKDPKFEVGNHVRISKCKIIFAKGYTLNWCE